EAGVRETTAVAIEERLGELELPVKQPAVGARLIRGVEIPPRGFCWKRASAGERGVRQWTKRRRRNRRAVRCKPCGAPHVRDALPPRQRRVTRRQLRKRALFRAHLLDGVVRRAFERKPDRQRLAQRTGCG